MLNEIGEGMNRLIDETPIGVVAMIGGFGFVQSIIDWASPILQFFILLGSTILVGWKVYFIYQSIKKNVKHTIKAKKSKKYDK